MEFRRSRLRQQKKSPRALRPAPTDAETIDRQAYWISMTRPPASGLLSYFLKVFHQASHL
jgi:hypothetical protein